MDSIFITVVCLVLHDTVGKVLTTRRPVGKRLGLLWEFPGGKVESGESPEQALRREIYEELGIELGKLEQLPEVEYSYQFGSIRLLPFISQCEVRPPLRLTEHEDARWITLNAWNALEWAPADIPVIKNLLCERVIS